MAFMVDNQCQIGAIWLQSFYLPGSTFRRLKSEMSVEEKESWLRHTQVRIYEVKLLRATPPPECNPVLSLVLSGVCSVRTGNVWPVVTGIQVKDTSQSRDQ